MHDLEIGHHKERVVALAGACRRRRRAGDRREEPEATEAARLALATRVAAHPAMWIIPRLQAARVAVARLRWPRADQCFGCGADQDLRRGGWRWRQRWRWRPARRRWAHGRRGWWWRDRRRAVSRHPLRGISDLWPNDFNLGHAQASPRRRPVLALDPPLDERAAHVQVVVRKDLDHVHRAVQGPHGGARPRGRGLLRRGGGQRRCTWRRAGGWGGRALGLVGRQAWGEKR